ncbi:binding-protein-dependent transport systems inner membrane component [Xylanimonas cellulosilytica DSM 15894]|uniref:Binding-protein-dependent transport systems inner membrane component n=1 Tax=Xylanimonas cellulosilytica (strain DSM 15894 / JCM 12276 / CECT 5975 / KCTC 9989 / LMG 20990 / NBRC 107835 / XIL07) TaxID=446471 RepID=D1BXX8_XYLCX|nr:sugar ABC transporter permease [Xylanimonas cellulosilytica]ACZ31769.1 binding-protein-dependent transport systems inner membrane component [Xylanimonas cellulosilytica DSM 15894]
MSTNVELDEPRAESARGSSPVLRASKKKVRWYEVVGFTVPALLVYVAFVFVPIAFAVVMALFDGNRIAPLRDFVGFDNFVEIFTGGRTFGMPFFWDAVQNNLLIAVLSLLIQGPIAIAVALLLNRKMKFRGLVRVLIFVPYVLSEVITAVMFQMLLAPNGAIAVWLRRLGMDGLADTQWLADIGHTGVRSATFWTLMVVLTWKYIGLAIILFLAGLSGIPEELNEAAQIDGASWWQIQRKITLPLLGPTLRIWAFLSIIGSFQLFDMVWILTRANPTIVGLDTMATYMVQMGMNRNRVGYGSAIAVVLFVMTLIVALTYQHFVLRRDVGKRAD